jgi:RNA polymerase sigma-70 factor, ECF subfamily
MKLVPRPPHRAPQSSRTSFIGDVGDRKSSAQVTEGPNVDSQVSATQSPVSAARPQTATVYDAYATFVWRSLQRMGVPESDLEDALQEVFIVVHRKLDQYDADRAKLSTWLFGITLNVARKHRTRGRLTLGADVDATACDQPSQDTQLQRRQQAERLNLVLGKMRPEHSATFVMFELEGLSCQEIADLTGVPVGTVYSRLHKARDQFKELVEKSEKAPRGIARLARAILGQEGQS